MRRFVALVAVALLLIGPPAASANNDPHRAFFGSAPIDLPTGYCPFPVHVDFPIDREYATESVLPDGSTAFKITGSWVARVSRPGSEVTIELNVGGPAWIVFSPDFSTVTEDLRGRTFLFATNLTAYGFPSDFVATAGPVLLTWDFASGAYTSLSGHPEVITDVCAALA